METIKIGVGVGLVSVILLFTCGSFFAEDVQGTEKTSSLRSDKTNIFLLADSLNSLTEKADIDKSLIYKNNNYTFQICKYSLNSTPFLYVEKGKSFAGDEYEKKYYLNKNGLALYTEDSRLSNSSKPYLSTRIYFENDEAVFAEQKSSLTEAGLQAVNYQRTDLSKTTRQSDITLLEDALNQRGQFDLVFDGIADYPKAKYIILSRKGYNSYRAPIRVNNEDEFVHELSTNAFEYRGEKLDIDWKIGDTNEVIYQSGKLSAN